MNRIRVIPAHVLLIYSLGVMGNRPVILPGVPVLLQLLRKFDHVRDLCAGISLVQVKERLVIDKLVGGCRIENIFHDILIVPVRPVVRLEHHLNLLAVQLQGLHQEIRPGLSVANLRSSERIQVMQGSRAVFCHPQGLFLREPGIHLGRSFRSGRELELHNHAVNDHSLTGLRNGRIRRNVGGRPVGLPHSDSDAQRTLLSGLQQCAVLVAGPSSHGRSRVDILTHRMLLKSFRSDNQDSLLLHLIL